MELAETQVKLETVRKIWVEWSEKFLKLPQTTMTNEQVHIFMMCSMNEHDETFPGEGLEGSFLYKVIALRAKAYGLGLTKAVTTMVATLSDSPGVAVMYVVVMKYYAVKKGLSSVDMTEFSYMMPRGYPSRESLHSLWDEQKGCIHGLKGVDNILDTLRPEMMHL